MGHKRHMDPGTGKMELFSFFNSNRPQEQIMIMNLTDAGPVGVLPTLTEYSCHPNHGLTLLSSSRDPFRFGIPRVYL